MRIFLGFLVAAIALSGALYLHSGAKLGGSHSFTDRVTTTYVRDPAARAKEVPVLNTVAVLRAKHWHASWQDPLAVLIAVAGVGAGVAIALPAIRRGSET